MAEQPYIPKNDLEYLMVKEIPRVAALLFDQTRHESAHVNLLRKQIVILSAKETLKILRRECRRCEVDLLPLAALLRGHERIEAEVEDAFKKSGVFERIIGRPLSSDPCWEELLHGFLVPLVHASSLGIIGDLGPKLGLGAVPIKVVDTHDDLLADYLILESANSTDGAALDLETETRPNSSTCPEAVVTGIPVLIAALDKKYPGLAEPEDAIRRQVMLISAFEGLRILLTDCPDTLDNLSVLKAWFDKHPNLPHEVETNLGGIHTNMVEKIATHDTDLSARFAGIISNSVSLGVSAAQRDMISRLDTGLGPKETIEALMKALVEYASAESGNEHWRDVLEKIKLI